MSAAVEAARAALTAWDDGGRIFPSHLAAALRALLAEHERLTAPAEHPLDALWDGTPSTARAIANAKAQERLTAPPTDDDREALITESVRRYPLDLDGWNRDRNADKSNGFREGAEWAFSFRRQGPITDAQVEAAWLAWNGTRVEGGHTAIGAMRAALDAARAER